MSDDNKTIAANYLAQQAAAPVPSATVEQGFVPDVLSTPVSQFTAPDYEPTLADQLNTPEAQARQDALMREAMTAGHNPIEGLKNAAMPVAEVVAGSDLVKPSARTSAANFVADRRDNQIAEIADKQAAISGEDAALAAALARMNGNPAPVEAPPTPQEAEEIVATQAIPTREEIAATAAAHPAIVETKRGIANSLALEQAQKEQESYLAASEARAKQMQAEIDKITRESDNAVRTMSLPEIYQRGDFGQKLLASLSIALGAMSTGGKGPNPAVEMINSVVKQESDAKRLSDEKKEALRKALLGEANLRLDAIKNATDNDFKKQQISIMQGELQAKINETEFKQAQVASKSLAQARMSAGAPIDDADIYNLSEFQQRSIVRAGGKTYLASNPEAAVEFKKFTGEAKPALDMLKKFKPIVESGGWRSLGKKGLMGYMKDKAVADTMQTAIVGALRLPYTGPGVLTDNERQTLMKAIGEYGLFKLPSVEAEKVKFVIKDLESRIQSRAEDAGVRAQVVDRKYVQKNGRMIDYDSYVQDLAAKTGASPSQIDAALKKQGF
jgi:hypothetical protein